MSSHRFDRSLALALVTLTLAGLASGCSALVDGTLAGRGGADAGLPGMDSGPRPDTGPTPDTGPQPDTGPASPCAGMANGLRCSITGIDEPFICFDGVCQLSRCGDGVRDDRTGSMHATEQCDDGNMTDGDGCDSDCTFSCTQDADCADTETCNGMETCDSAGASATHTCQPGTDLADTTPCTVMGTAAVCHSGACRSGVCPDGVTDPGEECDDHNANDGDGCEHDCTFTCVADTDCQDGDPCNGSETCNVASHVCVAAVTALDCNDGDTCTNDSCVAMTGCVHASVLVDTDADGYFAITSSCGGDDCNDGSAAVHPGPPEACGSSTDLNCDGVVGMPSTWYVDCDNDTYAPNTTGSVTACTAPAPQVGCTGPGWTTRQPRAGAVDCWDNGSTGASIHPGQTAYYSTSPSGFSPAFDYDCNGSVSHAVVLFGHPYSPSPSYVECAYVSAGSFQICTGTSYWDQTSIPACGVGGSLSHCSVTALGCRRVVTAGSLATCH